MMLEQTRAAMAYDHVANLRFKKNHEEQKKRYGIMALKLTALIRSAGLCQALHFIKSRNKEPYNELLKHVALQLKRRNGNINNKDSLCDEVRKANVQQYLLLTREALAVANWYGRLAQSELNVKLTDDARDEGEDDDES